jgi:pentatricopeptide repeat protein
MKLAGVKPDLKCFASVLPACANLAALEKGMEIHEEINRSEFQLDVFVENALIDMYAKCGQIDKARELFDKMCQRYVVSWNTMIGGYAVHGLGKEAIKLFEQMQQSGVNPDHVTFVCVLSACCHAGLVDEGWQYFDCMGRDYHIQPTMEHYVCMVDLLGRAGRLDEAEDFINKMAIKHASVWRCLLGVCKLRNNVELGERVAERLYDLDPENATPYVLLSSIYAAAGRWDDAKNVRRMMKDRMIKKTPGCSWIEVNKQVHAFLMGERSHPQAKEISAKLETLTTELKTTGYVLHDVEEEQEEEILCHHSNKWAIAFA